MSWRRHEADVAAPLDRGLLDEEEVGVGDVVGRQQHRPGVGRCSSPVARTSTARALQGERPAESVDEAIADASSLMRTAGARRARPSAVPPSATREQRGHDRRRRPGCPSSAGPASSTSPSACRPGRGPPPPAASSRRRPGAGRWRRTRRSARAGPPARRCRGRRTVDLLGHQLGDEATGLEAVVDALAVERVDAGRRVADQRPVGDRRPRDTAPPIGSSAEVGARRSPESWNSSRRCSA